MDYKNFFKILNGNFEKIPVDKPQQVRIFLSSTFSGKWLYILCNQISFSNKRFFLFWFLKILIPSEII